MSNAFVEKGDTVRFKWDSGTYVLQTTDIPVGESHWMFVIDQNNRTKDVVVNSSGWYNFTINSITNGRIVCIDPNLPVRYFEFKMLDFPSSENFIVATSDVHILKMVDSLLGLPEHLRLMHIKGLLGYTNDGYNNNWTWHIIKNKWRLAAYSEEVCDGWPTFVSSDLSYWVDFLGYFCPWSSRLYKEVYPNNILDVKYNTNNMIYPNPAEDRLFIDAEGDILKVLLFDIAGKCKEKKCSNGRVVDISDLQPGIYTIVILTDKGIINQIVKCGK